MTAALPAKPTVRPANPNFSSGPCAKRPGWTPQALSGALLGRSHRAKPGKAKLKEVIDRHRTLLGIPDDYRIGIVPASDTGAMEMVLWSMLGARGVDVLAWETFGKTWATDIRKELKLSDARIMEAAYGHLPDVTAVDWSRDVVFPWNGTTSGVRVPNADWIADDREGLAICDATSAVFAMDLPWQKLDVVTWSWQKVLGGEAAHGMLVISPKAAERLCSYTPPWPLPKIFRMSKGGALIEGLWEGDTINTPSMLAVEDALDALKWAGEIGGTPTLIAKSEASLAVIAAWEHASDWASFLPVDPATRSCTSVCLTITAPWFTALPVETQTKAAKRLTGLLDTEGVGYDLGSYRDAPPGIRIWTGATVETADIEALLPWLDWAAATVAAEYSA